MAGLMEEKELESKRDKRRAPKPPPKPKRGRKYSRDSSLTTVSMDTSLSWIDVPCNCSSLIDLSIFLVCSSSKDLFTCTSYPSIRLKFLLNSIPRRISSNSKHFRLCVLELPLYVNLGVIYSRLK